MNNLINKNAIMVIQTTVIASKCTIKPNKNQVTLPPKHRS